jgi:hypothetical protein
MNLKFRQFSIKPFSGNRVVHEESKMDGRTDMMVIVVSRNFLKVSKNNKNRQTFFETDGLLLKLLQTDGRLFLCSPCIPKEGVDVSSTNF